VIASSKGFAPSKRAWIGFANILGMWTMFPLLKRDKLELPYTILTLVWAFLLGLPPFSFALYGSSALHWSSKGLHVATYVLMLAWHIVEATVDPPAGKPDLWVVVNVLIGTAGFVSCYIWCLYRLVLDSKLFERQGKAKKA
jgi:alpha-1,3-glucosyltransferase